ncbi:hypothetical protein U8527_11815 [Kordia algicida OT-1]|uniref:Uncharacterized protein n=1 Tax=Kordia algicida OT-1 TaxID=391587 RepID=A9E058_9FLAO|nr:hypothetical protein [Kordia algicida]EDP95802.1 hypothetical protein KAOT1_05342 [Kordia algicida OT-1]
MKKQNLKTLKLKKVSISKFEINGGLAPRRGESEFNTVCPMCETEDCPTQK